MEENELSAAETVDPPAEATPEEKGEDLEERNPEERRGEERPDGEGISRTDASSEAVSPPASAVSRPSVPDAQSCGEAERIETAVSRYGEVKDLLALYPDLRLAQIPEEVWQSPLPMAAAYAVYRRRAERDVEIAEQENRKNRERAAGGIRPSGEIYYSPSEVRRMTQQEVRSNYDAILRSMQSWR